MFDAQTTGGGKVVVVVVVVVVVGPEAFVTFVRFERMAVRLRVSKHVVFGVMITCFPTIFAAGCGSSPDVEVALTFQVGAVAPMRMMLKKPEPACTASLNPTTILS